ncbi:porin family protein [Zobellia laminariae]|uniref:type IX secretion/gliding motility protein PorT/SprT n=1 Tax=Zobellia laminariae TaxID=248906 RepID=UPI0026F474C2|nr:porin family protein [Zobellia laminariae]WKX77220.1 porin family protein [Zobellia laminariae]
MKRFFLLLGGILFLSLPANAQFNPNPVLNIENKDKKLLNYGYFLGFNRYGFKFDYKQDSGNQISDVQVTQTTGFNVGLIGELRLNEFLDLRFEPGLYYNARNVGFIGFDDPKKALREVKSTYINFPILLKIGTRRYGNFKPFLVAGPSASLNLGSNEKSLDDNSSGTFRMNKWSYNYELGFGIDFYLEYFKFTPSIRGVFGLTDEIVRDNDPNSQWTGNIESMKTRGLFINFTFE